MRERRTVYPLSRFPSSGKVASRGLMALRGVKIVGATRWTDARVSRTCEGCAVHIFSSTGAQTFNWWGAFFPRLWITRSSGLWSLFLTTTNPEVCETGICSWSSNSFLSTFFTLSSLYSDWFDGNWHFMVYNLAGRGDEPNGSLFSNRS